MMLGCQREKLNITTQIDHAESRPRQRVLTRELQVCRYLRNNADIVKSDVSDHVEVDNLEIVKSSVTQLVVKVSQFDVSRTTKSARSII